MKGHHVALRVPDFEASKRRFVEKLDFRVVCEWPDKDLRLAYLAPGNDNSFYIEIIGGGSPNLNQILAVAWPSSLIPGGTSSS